MRISDWSSDVGSSDLGRGDEAFTAEVPRKLDARRVMIAGMQGWNADEDLILKELGIRHIPPAVLADSSRPILDWIETEGITHLAVHFDLDVLDPAHFSPLLFNRPGMPEDRKSTRLNSSH